MTFNGGVAPAHGSATLTDTYPGTATSASKTITGGWPSHPGPLTHSASVSMAGNCTTPPVDQCPNIDGVQVTVPPGMTKDANGNCVTPPPPPPPPMSDDCPNLPDIQGSVPEGMIKDGNGDCVPRPVVTATTTSPAPLVQQAAPATSPAQPAAAPAAPAQPVATPPVTSGVKAEVKTKGKQSAAKKVKKAKKAKKVKAKKAKSKRARGAVLPITK